jgi:hypothetical protein
MKITFCQDTKDKLLALKKEKGISIEGNILKLIEYSDDPKMEEYVKDSIKQQKSIQRKRLEVTKRVQSQNDELINAKAEIERVNLELTDALSQAETAKDSALKDLDLLQKKTQFELMGTIIKVALIVIIGVGISTTALYIFSLFTGKDTDIIGNTWSNILGILLTNSFSIVGTIMGVKYATKNKEEI